MDKGAKFLTDEAKAEILPLHFPLKPIPLRGGSPEPQSKLTCSVNVSSCYLKELCSSQYQFLRDHTWPMASILDHKQECNVVLNEWKSHLHQALNLEHSMSWERHTGSMWCVWLAASLFASLQFSTSWLKGRLINNWLSVKLRCLYYYSHIQYLQPI